MLMKVALGTLALTQTAMWKERRWLTIFTADGGDRLDPDGDEGFVGFFGIG